jgi:hypothetical protein
MVVSGGNKQRMLEVILGRGQGGGLFKFLYSSLRSVRAKTGMGLFSNTTGWINSLNFLAATLGPSMYGPLL